MKWDVPAKRGVRRVGGRRRAARGVAVVAAAVVRPACDQHRPAESPLAERQRVHVGAQADAAAGRARDADDPGSADAFVHVEAATRNAWATTLEVRCSWNPQLRCACRSRRNATSAGSKSATGAAMARRRLNAPASTASASSASVWKW